MIGYSPEGIHDGQVTVPIGTHFTILDDRRVWARNQRFEKQEVEPFVTVLKDWDLHFPTVFPDGRSNFPKANAGPPRAGNIDSVTGLLTVEFDASDSYSLPGGTGIVAYLWEVADGTITVGTEEDAQITVTFPAGRRYVGLTVEDSDGYIHKMEIPVYARDPDDDDCVAVWQVSISGTQEGQRMSVRVFSNLPRTTYPDGCFVIFFDDEDPDHYVEFYGWIYTDPSSVEFVETGALRDTTLECYDITGMLDRIPGQSQSLEHRHIIRSILITEDAAAGSNIVIVSPLEFELEIGDVLHLGSTSGTSFTMTSNAAIGATALGITNIPEDVFDGDQFFIEEFPEEWGQSYRPNMHRVIDYILRFHSNGLELADLLLPGVDSGIFHNVHVKECAANTIYKQVQEVAHSICYDHNIGTNRKGQMVIRIDQLLLDPFFRTEDSWGSLNGHIASIRMEHTRAPRYQWIRGGAVEESWDATSTLEEVDYIIRPSATASIGATSVSVYPLHVDIPDNATIYKIGLEGQLLPWITLNGAHTAGATTLTVDALTEQVEVWDEYQYTAQETGPDKLVLLFCIAPGLTTGMGSESLTVNNKVASGIGELCDMIGNLWARLNNEWGYFDIDLTDDSLEHIDPAEFIWVEATEIAEKYVPQRNLPFFEADTRFLPLQIDRSYSYGIQGVSSSISLRLEREVSGIQAVPLTEDDV
jgi:hypothetical protein